MSEGKASYVDIPRVQNLGGVYLLDTRHGGMAGTIGSYLLPGPGGSFALIESGPGSTVETLLAGIREVGLEPEGLEAVLVTHIHLDHAGAAGELTRRFGATVYVHESGTPHLAEPRRLVKSAGRIYGDEMDSLWGKMEPVPAGRLWAVVEGDTLEVLGHTLEVLYTPGHASHHVAYLLEDGTLFTGDAAAIKLTGSEVVRPALPPPEVDLELWDASLQNMREADPTRLLLTHFGEVKGGEEHLEQVREQNHKWAEVILKGMQAGEDENALEARLAKVNAAELEADGAPPEVVRRHKMTSNDAMTVMGLTRYWRKHHPERLEP